MRRLHHDVAAAAPDPRLEAILRRLTLLGLLLVLTLPAARASTTWFGLLPLWLLGMPLASWWALHRFALPSWRGARPLHASNPPARRMPVQARRRAARPQHRLPRAA